MSILFEWKADRGIVNVDLSIISDVLIEWECLFSCSTGVQVPNDWAYLGGFVDVNSKESTVYYLSESPSEQPDTVRLDCDSLDYYLDELLPQDFRKHRLGFHYTWCEIVKEVGTFSSPIRVTVQHFFRTASGFNRELFVKALGELPTSVRFDDPDSVVVDMQFEFNEQSLLDTLAISYIASQVSGGSYHGWEVNVLEIAELIQKNDSSN